MKGEAGVRLNAPSNTSLWYVFVECAKRGILWRGLIHDWSKILPSEFVPYYKRCGEDTHEFLALDHIYMEVVASIAV